MLQARCVMEGVRYYLCLTDEDAQVQRGKITYYYVNCKWQSCLKSVGLPNSKTNHPCYLIQNIKL